MEQIPRPPPIDESGKGENLSRQEGTTEGGEEDVEVDEAGQNPVNVNLEDSSGSSEVLIEAGQGATPTVRLESNQAQSNSNGPKKPLIIWCMQTVPPHTKGKINLEFTNSIDDLPAAPFEPQRSARNTKARRSRFQRRMRFSSR